MAKRLVSEDFRLGQQIKTVFESRQIKLSDFAKELGTVRQNVYRIFKKRNLDTGLLLKICDVLDYNFFVHYQTEDTTDKESNAELNEYKKQLELSYKEIDYLKKIINLMEDKAKLLQDVSPK